MLEPDIAHTRTVSQETTLSTSNTTPVGRSTLADLLHLLGHDGLDDADAAQAAGRMAVGLRRVPAGHPLMHMGAPADALYFVHSGTFKIFRSDEDGYEQVLAFAGRREVLAFDALCVEAHPTAAMALEDSTVYVVRKTELPAFSLAVPAFGRALQRAGSLALSRTNDLVDIMAAVASEVRLARFLLQHSHQMAANGQSPRRFLLRMGRRDIASMLGVAHETVSRSFTTLALARLIHVNDRDVEILDMDALRAYSRSTRKALDDVGLQGARRPCAPRQLPAAGLARAGGLRGATH
jgi:CRP/FNR family transcriptional regulator